MHRPAFLVMGVALVACLALTACAAPTGVQTSTSPGGSSQPKVNRLVFITGAPGRPDLDLRHLAEPYAWAVRPMYDFLINVDAKTGKLVPGLASEWKLEPDGQSYRVKLREANFHGKWGPVRAEDVKFGWEQVRLPDSLHGQRPYFVNNIKDVEVVGDRELIFKMNAPDGIFPAAVSEYQGGIEARSKANYDANGAPTWQTGPLAGSGPYMWKEGAEDRFYRYERANNNHWAGTPDFPEFEFRYAKEASTRLAALLTGEAHIADLPQDLMQQAERQSMKTLRGQFSGTRVWATIPSINLKDPKDPSQGYNHPESPLMDKRVRQALNKAINRDEMNKAFFGGKGELMVLNHFNASRSGWNPDWEKRFNDLYGYDVSKAKALLADAGQPNLKTTMLVAPLPGVSGGEDLTEAIANYWRQIGVTVTLQTVEIPERTRLTRAMAYPNHIYLSATGSNQWSGASIWNSSLNHLGNGAENPRVDALLRQIATTTDQEKQDALWRQTGDFMFDETMGVNLFWLPTEAVGNPQVVGEWTYPGGITGAWTHIVNIKAAR